MKKLGLLPIALIAIVVLLFVVVKARAIGLNQDYAPDQPIKFSHKVHAGDNKIQCLYCHFAAERGRHAGIPPVELCMNCHTHIKLDSPEVAKIKSSLENGKTIEWIRVHHLPDFAYFNHSQHVKVAGLKCQTCHGPVESFEVMKQSATLSMGWCMDCHREKEIAPPNDHKSAAGGDCAKCHY